MSTVKMSEAENNSAETSTDDLADHSSNFSFKQLLKSIGPGMVTGASDDDPSGIATYSFQIFGSYKIISAIFKLFTISLLSYFLCAFFIKFDWMDVLRHTLVPNRNSQKATGPLTVH